MTAPEETRPASTYRLQLNDEFTFADAAAQVPYLADLGVGHLYLSPILQPVPGSAHGYDVLDHSRISDDLGGEAGLRTLVEVAREHDLGVIVDLVPNHMAFVAPESANRPLWQVLREGQGASTAHWFDIDWAAGDGRLGIPILGNPLEQVIADGELTVVDDPGVGEPVLRYYEHLFPLAAGTDLDADLATVLAAQHYRLAYWRDKDQVLNYRRFFEVDELIAVRVEDEDVFDATHEVLLRLHHEGLIDGFRIDHPDGLADPAGYLERLAANCRPGTPVWIEKILEPGEELADLATAGTTGYDALRVIQTALLDPAAAPALNATWSATGGQQDFHGEVAGAKREIVTASLVPEIQRLTRRAVEALPQLDPERLHQAVSELATAAEVYRAYVRTGHSVPEASRSELTAAFTRAESARPDLATEIEALIPLCLFSSVDAAGAVIENTGAADDFAVRIQQTWGPVMAKSVEDTAFYRYHRLVAVNEVGGDPADNGAAGVEALHAWAERTATDLPDTMTTLSTHDTKRSEDVRARLIALAGDTAAWQELSALAAAEAATDGVDLPTAHLIWQTLVGVGPIDDERLTEYLTKAVREAKVHTAWVDGDPEYEQRVLDLARRMNAAGPLRTAIDAATTGRAEAIRATVLGQKLLQLTLPGVPDVYQGCESVDLSLVDPDNRRPVDWAGHRRLLDSTTAPDDPEQVLSWEKLRLTATVLQTRQSRPEFFDGSCGYRPWFADTEHLVGFARTAGGRFGRAGAELRVAVTRAPVRLADGGGWGDASLQLPRGSWRDLLTDTVIDSDGTVAAADLFAHLPVAMLAKED
ncbi:malto-oligosyltrehalose synthase [Dermacoccaceae bacterium W4C1]